MDNNEKFNSINDLYKRVLPALQAKVSELKREKINFVDAIDIWNYCTENIWKNKRDLRIYELVDDILSVDGLKLEIYVRNSILNYKKIIDRNDLDER